MVFESDGLASLAIPGALPGLVVQEGVFEDLVHRVTDVESQDDDIERYKNESDADIKAPGAPAFCFITLHNRFDIELVDRVQNARNEPIKEEIFKNPHKSAYHIRLHFSIAFFTFHFIKTL